MKGLHAGWYLVIGFVALAPVGVRVLTWSKFRLEPIDPEMARAGQTLFVHEWKPGDPLSPGGDGLGPVYNATSCVACHNQGGLGGAGKIEHNVTTFVVREMRPGCQTNQDVVREGVVHSMAWSDSFREKLNQVHPELPMAVPTVPMIVPESSKGRSRIAMPSGVHLSQRNTPALFGANLIDAIPDRLIIANERKERLQWGLAPAKSDDLPAGRALRLPDGRVGHFGWKAQSASLSSFVQAACANELGLGNPGQAQPRPLGKPDYQPTGLDLTQQQCDQITAFVASLPRPIERLPEASLDRERVNAGKRLFERVGCADCHTPNVGGIEGLYSDLLLHDMGQPLEGGGSYNDPPPSLPDRTPGDGPQPGEWRTPPLWGVADSAPYLHDGRAKRLEEAIELHGGQAARSARRFAKLGKNEQAHLIAFLETLRAP
jgi:CxxC motif-containing protein (DUF1111 family)